MKYPYFYNHVQENDWKWTSIVSCLRLPVLYIPEYFDVLEIVYEMFVFKQQKMIINQHSVSDPPHSQSEGGGGRTVFLSPTFGPRFFPWWKKEKLDVSKWHECPLREY